MSGFGGWAFIGLMFGFMWGIGCSLAILYSIFLAGYRKGVEESMAEKKSQRYLRAIEKIGNRRTASRPSIH